jgi:uncharacterized repeat protein (TIGR01451 family)
MALIALLALSATLVQADPGLSIQKYAPDVAIAGTEMFYYIYVSNDGITDTNAYVTDTLPAEVVYIADTGGCTEAGGVLTCPLGDLEAGAYRDFEVKVRVAPEAVAGEDDGTIVIANTASVSSTEEYAETSAETFVEDEADLTVIKMSKPDTQVRAGEPFVYTIFVENLGPSFARNVAIRDEIVLEPLGDASIVSVVSDLPAACDRWAEPWGWTIECYLTDTLSVKDIETAGRWVIQVTMEGNETQDVNNVVNVFTEEGGTPDPDLSNNTAEDFISVTDVAELSVDKYVSDCWYDGMDGDGMCVAGGYVEFTLDVYNNGPSAAENVVVEDLLPAGVTVVEVDEAVSCTTGIPGDPLAPLTCNLGNIPSGERTTFYVVVQIDPDYVDAELPFDSRPLQNDAWAYSDIFDDDNSDNRDHVIIDIYTLSQLAITKWGFPELAGVGDDVEYEIRIWNFGPSTADTVQFADLLPSTVDYKDYYIEQGTGNCVYHDPLSHPWWDEYRGVHCYVDEIPPNGVVMVHIFGTYNESLWWADPMDTCNIIPDDDPMSMWTDTFGIEDEWFYSGWWADSYIVIPWENSQIPPGEEPVYMGWCPYELNVEADLSITKTSEPMKLYPGEQKLYHIQVTNNGPTGAPEVLVTDTLPVSVTYEIDNGGCNRVAQDPDVLECSLGNMMPGETKAFDVWALVSRDAPPGEITNEAHVFMGGDDGYYDPNEENNWAYATNLVLEPIFADLSLQKSFGEAPPGAFGEGWAYGPEDCYLYDEGMNLYGIRAGCPLTYTLVITNSGPLVAENVVVEDSLPAGVVVENVGAQQGSCTTGLPGDPLAPLTCNLGNIPPGEDRRIDIIAVSDSDLAWEHLENDAVVSSDIPDPDDANNRSHVLTWVEPFSYLNLVKQGPTDIMAGEEIQYWIDLWNEGPSTAQNVHLDDQLPGGVSLLDAQVMIGDGSCAPNSTLCSLGDLAPHEWNSVRVRGYVEAWLEDGTVITNTANAWADTPLAFSTFTNTVTTTVHSAADLSIWKSADPYKVYAGEQVRYDITVANNGPSVAHNVLVTDTLDPGVEYEIDTSGCTPAGVGGAGVMLGSTTYGDPSLLSLDLGTAAPTFRGSLPYYTGADIEYDALSGKLYASMGSEWGYDGPQLHTIDPETGASLGFVELDAPCALPALEFVGSTLYATCHTEGHSGDSDLVTVDPTTGHVTYIGPTYRFRIHGLAYDEEAGIMYGVTYHDEDAGDLVSINLATGGASTVCSTYREDITGLDFGPGGILYAAIGGDHGTDRDLLTIDTESCDMTVVGQTGLSIMGLTWTGGDTGALNCGLGDIPPGETSTFSIWARVKPDTLGMINNRVDVTSDTEDPNPNNNWDSEANLVLGRADLRVQKFGKPEGEVRAGDELTYTIIVDNLGTGYAHNVALDDVMRSNGTFTLVSVTSTLPTLCEPSSGTYYRNLDFTCTLTNPLEVKGPMAGSGRWMLTVTVVANEPQSINNRADVESSDFDPDMSNNWDIAEHEITAVADLALIKEARGEMRMDCDGATELWLDEVAAGGMVTYTLTVSNTGFSTAENVVLLDEPLPSPELLEINVQSIKASQGSCQKGHIVDQQRLKCNLGTIQPGEAATVTFVAHVPSWVPDGTVLVNDAQVYSDMFDDNNGNDMASNQTVVSRVADLEVGKTQEPVVALPGQDVTYTIVVTNTGPSDAQGVIISDTLPVEVLNPTWSCCASDGQCDVPCEPPVCPPGECPWPDIGLFAQADIPAGELVIYTVEGVLDVWPCPLPITNTVEIIAPLSLVHPELDIDPCDDNNVAEAVNKVPFCTYDPLILKQYPGPDSPP